MTFYDTRFLNLLTTQLSLIIQTEWKSIKSFNEHITDLKCMTLYNDTCKNVRLVYKKKSLTDKNKKYYNQCWFLCDNNTISQLILSLIYWTIMNIQTSWLWLIDSWNYDISLLLNFLMSTQLLMFSSRMFLSCTNYLTQ